MITLLASAGIGAIGNVFAGAQGVKAAGIQLDNAKAQTDAMRAAFEMEKTKLAQILAADPANKQPEPPKGGLLDRLFGGAKQTSSAPAKPEEKKTNQVLLFGGIGAGVLLIGLLIFFITRKK